MSVCLFLWLIRVLSVINCPSKARTFLESEDQVKIRDRWMVGWLDGWMVG